MMVRVLRFGALALGVVVAACTGNITDSSPDGPAGSAPGGPNGPKTDPASTLPPGTVGKLKLDDPPAYLRIMRLTNEQWTNSVQSVLGLTTAPTQSEAFQAPLPGKQIFPIMS